MLNLPEHYFVRHFHYGTTGISLNCRASMCGYESPDPASYHWDGLKRGNTEFMLWQYTVAGQGELMFENRPYLVDPGQAMLVKIPHRHYYRVSPATRKWSFIFLILRGSESLRIGEKLITQYGPLSEYYSTESLLDAAGEILRLSDTVNPCDLSALSYRFMMTLARHSAIESNNISQSLLNARKYALQNFSSGIQVNDLARAANLSLSHFSREFSEKFQITPGDFLLQLQLEKSVNLLQNSTLTIKEIAHACGFASTSYFCRAFRHRFHTTPGALRK